MPGPCRPPGPPARGACAPSRAGPVSARTSPGTSHRDWGADAPRDSDGLPPHAGWGRGSGSPPSGSATRCTKHQALLCCVTWRWAQTPTLPLGQPVGGPGAEGVLWGRAGSAHPEGTAAPTPSPEVRPHWGPSGLGARTAWPERVVPQGPPQAPTFAE